MVARRIITWPDKSLKIKSDNINMVKSKDFALSLAMDLRDTMKANLGLGIAAPQVNIHKKMCVVSKVDFTSIPEDKMLEGCIVLINPAIEIISNDKVKSAESCLSIPGAVDTVDRYFSIDISYLNLSSEKMTFNLKGRDACIIQHEVDHLFGKLFIDRMSFLKKKSFIKKYTNKSSTLKKLTVEEKKEKSKRKAILTMKKNRKNRKKIKSSNK
jgi:peptide deformylase